ncbi:MAG: hypothetical protein OQK32_03870 [Gammaproteobacteria bacterium]|nr:hypothetical protein [Gammaproteobacteria bacterium]MCW8924004.1 hypothetical protein [Gammaproteobacteria bacterium]
MNDKSHSNIAREFNNIFSDNKGKTVSFVYISPGPGQRRLDPEGTTLTRSTLNTNATAHELALERDTAMFMVIFHRI